MYKKNEKKTTNMKNFSIVKKTKNFCFFLVIFFKKCLYKFVKTIEGLNKSNVGKINAQFSVEVP